MRRSLGQKPQAVQAPPLGLNQEALRESSGINPSCTTKLLMVDTEMKGATLRISMPNLAYRAAFSRCQCGLHVQHHDRVQARPSAGPDERQGQEASQRSVAAQLAHALPQPHFSELSKRPGGHRLKNASRPSAMKRPLIAGGRDSGTKRITVSTADKRMKTRSST